MQATLTLIPSPLTGSSPRTTQLCLERFLAGWRRVHRLAHAWFGCTGNLKERERFPCIQTIEGRMNSDIWMLSGSTEMLNSVEVERDNPADCSVGLVFE